jgi:uncharacterized protein YcaQ
MNIPFSKKPTAISLDTARTLAVIKQGLHQRPSVADKSALINSIRRIGLLQLDTVRVVARSHYLTMLSRVGLYDPADLDALLHPDRQLFEYWAHALCLIPAEDYIHFAPVILARREQTGYWKQEHLGDDPQAVLDRIMTEIKTRGPVSAKNFANSHNHRSSWWNLKPEKIALSILFMRGNLLVDRREKFQIYYDLAERVIPASMAAPTRTITDWERWSILRSVGCLGIATAKHVSDYYRHKMPVTRAILKALEADGLVFSLNVAGWQEPSYILHEDLLLLESILRGEPKLALAAFLSPFDNLTWNRVRLQELFGFEYSLGLYLPARQRRHGYYVMPILHNGRFVGRLDPKADRKTKTLILQSIYLEPGERLTDELLSGIIHALREFMTFHGSRHLMILQSEPKKLNSAIMKGISRL